MVQVLIVSHRKNIQSREKGNKLAWSSDWTLPGLSGRTETSMEGDSGEGKSIPRGNSENSRGRGSAVQLEKVSREGRPREVKTALQ